MSNPAPTSCKGKAWHQGESTKAAKRLRDGMKRNREAFEGKQALVHTYEKMGIPPPTDLRQRTRLKRWQLKNRGMMVDT